MGLTFTNLKYLGLFRIGYIVPKSEMMTNYTFDLPIHIQLNIPSNSLASFIKTIQIFCCDIRLVASTKI